MGFRGSSAALLIVLFVLFAGTAPSVSGQADDSSPDDEPSGAPEGSSEDDAFSDPFFADPFAAPDEDEAPDDESGTPEDAEDDLFSEDPFAADEFDSLFSDEQMIDTADEETMIANPQDDLLEQEGVRWGGRLRGSLSADWNWDDVWTGDFDALEPTSDSFAPSLGADLFFDARPDADFRVYGKLEIDTTTDDDGGIDLAFDLDALGDGALPEGWTTEENEDGDTVILDAAGGEIAVIAAAEDGTEGDEESEEEPEEEPALGTAPGLDISVFELFSDFAWNDTLFFRYGKHTIRWGAGYFFSPADVLNLSAVDPEDPTAEREGPLSLRTLYPFGLTGNAYLYLITNTGVDILDVAVAPRVEFVLGPGELGVGAYYQRTLAPRLAALYTATIAEVDLFGEAVGLWGSDRVFVRPSRDQSAATADPEDDLDLVLDTYELERGLFLQATAGARYLKDWDDGPSLVLIGQYFFNGEGYDGSVDGLLPAAARLALNPGENGLAIEDEDAQPESYEPPPALGFDDLTNWGRHYAGATVSLSSLFLDDLSLSVFGLVNLSDLSGIATPSISYSFLDRFSTSLSARFTFGPPDGEYTDPAALFSGADGSYTFGLTLSVSMPGGSF